MPSLGLFSRRRSRTRTQTTTHIADSTSPLSRTHSWFIYVTTTLSASSFVRYIIVLVFVVLISVVYFVTTRQVLKPSGTGPSILSQYIAVNSSAHRSWQFPNSAIDPEQPSKNFENPNGVTQRVSGNISDFGLSGVLYDRGDGCLSITNVSNISGIIPVIPLTDAYIPFGIGLVNTNTTGCSIEEKFQLSYQDQDIGLIVYTNDDQNTTMFNNISFKNFPVFSVNAEAGQYLRTQLSNLQTLYNSSNKTKWDALYVLLKPYQMYYVNSWLFAMFAVGAILVISFFISVLIHMRLYRLRRRQQEEINRQREIDELMGMRKWTLEQDVLDTFPIIIYSDEREIETRLEEVDLEQTTIEPPRNIVGSSASSPIDAKYEIREENLSRQQSIRSTRSFKEKGLSRRGSNKSTRSENAILNATNLYKSRVREDDNKKTTGVIIHLRDSNQDRELEITCAICLEDFENGDKIRELPCSHWYHVECIDPWLINKSSSCPLCKKDCRPQLNNRNSNELDNERNIENGQQIANGAQESIVRRFNNSVERFVGNMFRRRDRAMVVQEDGVIDRTNDDEYVELQMVNIGEIGNNTSGSSDVGRGNIMEQNNKTNGGNGVIEAINQPEEI